MDDNGTEMPDQEDKALDSQVPKQSTSEKPPADSESEPLSHVLPSDGTAENVTASADSGDHQVHWREDADPYTFMSMNSLASTLESRGRYDEAEPRDAATGASRQTLKGHSGWVRQTIASASDDRTVRLWDAATGASRQTLKGHSDWVNAVAFSPNG